MLKARPSEELINGPDTGSLPGDWIVASLGDLAEKPEYGFTASAEPNPIGPQFLRITDIQDGRVDWSAVPFCRCKSSDRERLALKAGDILVARIGATTGKTCLIDQNADALFASYLIRIRTKTGLLPEFLYFFTKSKAYLKQIDAVKGGRLKQGVNIPVLQALYIPVPPLEEQRAIAHVLRTVQQAKEATEKVIAATRQLKQSLVDYLFRFEPVSSEHAERVELYDSSIGQIPRHWKEIRLQDVLREPLRNGHSAPATASQDGIRTLILTAVTRNEFSLKNTKVTSANPERVRDMWLKPGDIFVERANTPEYVGLAALYDGVEDFAIFPDLLVRVRCKTDEIIPKFLAEALLLPSCRNYFKMNAKKTAGNFPKIDQPIIEDAPIPLPPLNEQKEICSFLSAVDKKRRTEEIRRDALEKLFGTLLQNLMSGQIRLTGFAAERASCH